MDQIYCVVNKTDAKNIMEKEVCVCLTIWIF